MIMLNGKDSFWLQLEVCREYQRSRCTRSDSECKFAHPPTNVEIQSNGRVTACYDSIKGRCQRESCKYMHPPAHLKDQLLINGRNHLALKNALLQQQQHQQHFQDPHNHNHSQNQHQHPQQQAALFQSAVAAAAAHHQHLTSTSHHQTTALNPHNHHLKPAAYDLSMQAHPAAALVAAIAASSMNPFMAPGAFTHTYANQYAAAVAAAAVAAQQQQQHRQSPRVPTFASAPAEPHVGKQKSNAIVTNTPSTSTVSTQSVRNNNGKRDLVAASLTSGLKAQQTIKAPPTHYPTPANHAVAIAAAAVAAAKAPVQPEKLAAYYMNPAALAAAMLGPQPTVGANFNPYQSASFLPPKSSGIAPTSTDPGAQAHYQSVLSALYNVQPLAPAASSGSAHLYDPAYYQRTLHVSGTHRGKPNENASEVDDTDDEPAEGKSCDKKAEPRMIVGEKKIANTVDIIETLRNEPQRDTKRDIMESSQLEINHDYGTTTAKLKEVDEEDPLQNAPTKRQHLDLSLVGSPSASSASSEADDDYDGDADAARSGLPQAKKDMNAPSTTTSVSSNPDKTNSKQQVGEKANAFEPNHRKNHENGIDCATTLLLSDYAGQAKQMIVNKRPKLQQPLASQNGNSCQVGQRPSNAFRLEICREFSRNSCKRKEHECKFAHPPVHIMASHFSRRLLNSTSAEHGQLATPSGAGDYVTVCMDFMNGRCARSSCKCRYLHPVAHLQCQLSQARRVPNWI